MQTGLERVGGGEGKNLSSKGFHFSASYVFQYIAAEIIAM